MRLHRILPAALIALTVLCTSCRPPAGDGGTTVKSPAPGAEARAARQRVYYYAAGFHGHPYFLDTHLGFRYAAQKFGCDIKTVGPQGWDADAQKEALEQVIAKKPDGIITIMWGPSGKPAVKKAMEAGIPVIVIEAMVPDHGGMTFIGLDNYACGEDTAKELMRIAREKDLAKGVAEDVAGKRGKVVASGNWGASNTDAKFQGVKDYLAKNSEWEIVGKIDDKAVTADAIKAAKSMFNTYKDIDAIVGLDASSGTGIGIAIEDLNLDASRYTIVVHDREEPVLEFIEKGIIDSTVINKTGLCAYMAIQMLEAYNDSRVGLSTVPIADDNKAAGVQPFPEFIYMGTEVITKDNVQHFMGKNIPQYK